MKLKICLFTILSLLIVGASPSGASVKGILKKGYVSSKSAKKGVVIYFHGCNKPSFGKSGMTWENFGLHISYLRFQISYFRFQISGFAFQVFRFQVLDFRF